MLGGKYLNTRNAENGVVILGERGLEIRVSSRVGRGRRWDKCTLQQMLYCTHERKENSEEYEEYMKLVVYVTRR